uniref:dihydrofolate reductase n=1 Tax=Clastoptera arizonana TaxID=38151 RepID=A0A1B6CLE9_9HEMI
MPGSNTLSRIKMNIIVAACESDLGIGKDGKLPWNLKSEMKYFSTITQHVKNPTKQNAVIMGRKTWESIPDKFRPLKSRTNIVLSSTMKSVENTVVVCSSFNKALDLINKPPLLDSIENIWVIGGASVYEEAMKHADCNRLYITWIKKTFNCDTFLPKIPLGFQEVECDLVPLGVQNENDIQFEVKVYEKGKENRSKQEILETCV